MPENKAIAIMGENPLHSILGAKNNFDAVANTTNKEANNKSRPFNFISMLFKAKIVVKGICPSSIFLNM